MKILEKYKTIDLLYIAIFAALGLAMKPIISPLFNSLFSWLPAGSFVGGFYMMWLALSVSVVNKTGSGILFGLTQGLLVLMLGWFGNHGIFSLVIYTLPAVFPEIIRFFFRKKNNVLYHIILCATANVTGTLFVALFILRLPPVPLLIALSSSLVSGGLGGIISHKLFTLLIDYRLINNSNK